MMHNYNKLMEKGRQGGDLNTKQFKYSYSTQEDYKSWTMVVYTHTTSALGKSTCFHFVNGSSFFWFEHLLWNHEKPYASEWVTEWEVMLPILAIWDRSQHLTKLAVTSHWKPRFMTLFQHWNPYTESVITSYKAWMHTYCLAII